MKQTNINKDCRWRICENAFSIVQNNATAKKPYKIYHDQVSSCKQCWRRQYRRCHCRRRHHRLNAVDSPWLLFSICELIASENIKWFNMWHSARDEVAPIFLFTTQIQRSRRVFSLLYIKWFSWIYGTSSITLHDHCRRIADSDHSRNRYDLSSLMAICMWNNSQIFKLKLHNWMNTHKRQRQK